MSSNIDEAFFLSLKNEFGLNSSSTFASSELLSSYSPIETLTSELDCLPTISQGTNLFNLMVIFLFSLFRSFTSTSNTNSF
jgi:hypothetical protein